MCSKYKSSLSSLSFYLVGIHVYTRNLSKKREAAKTIIITFVFFCSSSGVPSTIFSFISVHLLLLVLISARSPKFVVAYKIAGSSDVDENLENVALNC